MASEAELDRRFGPRYPNISGLSKFRNKVDLTAEEWKAYGQAVRSKLAALNAAALAREIPAHRCNCASGSYANSPAKIRAHMAKKLQAEFDAAVREERNRRTDQQIIAAYHRAMAEKRGE